PLLERRWPQRSRWLVRVCQQLSSLAQVRKNESAANPAAVVRIQTSWECARKEAEMKPLSTLCWIVLCGVVAWPALSLCADMSDSNPAPKAGAQSPSNAGQARAVTGTDLTFLNEAAPGGRAEGELGSVALKQ